MRATRVAMAADLAEVLGSGWACYDAPPASPELPFAYVERLLELVMMTTYAGEALGTFRVRLAVPANVSDEHAHRALDDALSAAAMAFSANVSPESPITVGEYEPVTAGDAPALAVALTVPVAL